MFEVSTVEDAPRVLQETDAEFVTVGIVDTQGMLRGKYISRRKFESALRDGMGVPAVTLGLDFHDVMAAELRRRRCRHRLLRRPRARDPGVVPGDRLGAPRRNLFFQLEYVGETAAVCTRNVLQRVLERAQRRASCPITGLEYEFTLFKETSDTVVAKGHRNLQVATPHSTYYVLQRQSAWAEFYGAIMDACRSLGSRSTACTRRWGRGSWRPRSRTARPCAWPTTRRCSRATRRRSRARRDLLLSFMARWSNEADGHSGHLHLSLRDTDRTPVLHDPDGPDGLSETMHHMLGGMQSLMPELLLMLAPNVNSFKRFVPGIFAPIAAFWGVENRSCALRAIPGTPAATGRVPHAGRRREPVLRHRRAGRRRPLRHRAPDRAGAAAAARRVRGRRARAARVPRRVSRRDRPLPRVQVARELFGDTFVDHFADTREWQEREFRALVTDRELERFFELA